LAQSGGGKKSIPNYKAYIDLLDSSLQNVTKTIVLVGVFPTDLGDLTLSQSDAEVMTFELELAFQYVYDEANGDPVQ
jgi:hypothetical protein